MSKKFSSMVFLLPFLCVVISGCGSKGDGYTGARGKVSGTITIDGQPLQKDCQIIFISKTGGYTAAGVIEEGGTYELVYSDGRGVPAVEYEIQFTAPVAVPSTSPADPAAMASAVKVGAKMKAADEGPVPTKYQSTNSSKMFFVVKDGENKADFDLKRGN